MVNFGTGVYFFTSPCFLYILQMDGWLAEKITSKDEREHKIMMYKNHSNLWRNPYIFKNHLIYSYSNKTALNLQKTIKTEFLIFIKISLFKNIRDW